MKRLFLIVSIMMSSAVTYAQSEVGFLTIQPKMGLNVANITDDDAGEPRVAIAAGAEMEYQIKKNFSMSAALMYSMQGSKVSVNYAGTVMDMTTKLDYINIPILANIYFLKGFALKFGVQPGFNVSSRYTLSDQGRSVSGSLSDTGINVKTFDFSIPVGLSYENKNIVIDARYNIGLTELVDGDGAKNRVIQFTLGYKFDLWKGGR